jgi:trans-2-enoyl-CoA reductase
MVVSDEKVLPVPKGISPEAACAMLSSAGIAYRLLHDFASLSAGDVIVQNDACSPVGRALIQLCKARGIKTVNILKDWYLYLCCISHSKKNCKCTEKLQGLGADVIIKESQLNGTVGVGRIYEVQDFIKMIKNLPPVKLVFNGRGGNVMSEVCKYVK